MRRFSCVLAVTIAAACLNSGTLAATSASPVNPFDTLDRKIYVDVYVGGSLGGAHSDRLFGRDFKRSERFEQALLGRLEAILRLEGFEPDPVGVDLVFVGIWGHQKLNPGGSIENVFFIELSVKDRDYRKLATAECERDLESTSRAIGVTSDDQLEAELASETLRLLEIKLKGKRR